MNRFAIRCFVLVVLIGGMVVEIAAARADAPKRPNVIILLTDDQGYGDLSCHGNPVLKTPNLDRLFARSVRFTSFHSAPMCTPSRGQIMTGQNALRNGATSVTAGRSMLRRGLPTMAEIFRMSGYRTGIFGKWHLGDNYPHRPMDRGFDEAIYHKGWGLTTSAPEYANTLFDGHYFHNGAPEHFKGFCTDFWFEQALKWMAQRKQKSEPFFCYLPTNAPHGPCAAPDKYLAPYKGKGPAAFFGMIANIDDNVGRLEKFLKDNNLFDDTIVIYMTDNGGTAGVPIFNSGMRGRKTQYYEGGHRVPCFVSWPAGNLLPPTDIATPTQMQDLLPTLIDLCQLKKPAQARFDGASLAGLLKGTEKQLPDRMLIVQYGQQIKKWDSCVIWNTWRLVHGTELYDLKTDAGQKTDVAAQKPDIMGRMRDHYEKLWREVEPLVNDYVPISVGSARENPVYLTSSDWQDIYSDNAGHIRQAVGGPRGSFWNVLVETGGDYEIGLRRWPRELDLPLTAAEAPKSKAFPIAGAKLAIAGMELATKTAPGDKEAVFRVHLKQGRTRLHGWFQNDRAEDQCGAFFAIVRRVDVK
jgi:arylsulfatase A-like enzyme